VKVIPYSGGMSVVDLINPLRPDLHVLTLTLECMTHMLALDEFSCTVTFDAGVIGSELKDVLKARSFTILPANKDALGMDALWEVCKSFDPDGIMNPGKFILKSSCHFHRCWESRVEGMFMESANGLD
jgi:FAD/FMN-containing dehydrogenase